MLRDLDNNELFPLPATSKPPSSSSSSPSAGWKRTPAYFISRNSVASILLLTFYLQISSMDEINGTIFSLPRRHRHLHIPRQVKKIGPRAVPSAAVEIIQDAMQQMCAYIPHTKKTYVIPLPTLPPRDPPGAANGAPYGSLKDENRETTQKSCCRCCFYKRFVDLLAVSMGTVRRGREITKTAPDDMRRSVPRFVFTFPSDERPRSEGKKNNNHHHHHRER